METKFQTSFIPKKPLVSDQKIYVSHGGTSILMIIASILFVVSLAGAIFTIISKKVIDTAQINYKIQLAESEKRFNTTLIEDLKKTNTKIDLVKKLLTNHLAVSNVFSIIGALTVDNVRFNSFDFSSQVKGSDGVKILMHGVGSSFSTIAFQSKIFGESNYGINKVLKNPVLADLAVDQNGKVGFTFSTTIDPSSINYEKLLNNQTIETDKTTDTIPDQIPESSSI